MNALLFALSFIWQLPQNIIALFILPFLGKLKLVRNEHLNLCFMGEKMSGGISLGNFSFVSPTSARHETSIIHENYGHAVQSHILGPLYLFVVGIPSILHTFHRDCPCYYHFYTERWANKLAHLEVEYSTGGYCRLIKKDETKC